MSRQWGLRLACAVKPRGVANSVGTTYHLDGNHAREPGGLFNQMRIAEQPPRQTTVSVAFFMGNGVGQDSLHPREARLLGPRAVPKRRNDFVRGRWVGRELARLSLGLDPHHVAILPDDQGVPWLDHDDEGRLPYSLSLSHTSGVAAAAMVELPCRVGVDVECPLQAPTAIARDYFAPIEARRYEGASDEEMAWRGAEVWSLKEAVLKALGLGLSVSASTVTVLSVEDTSASAGWYDAKIMVAQTVLPEGMRVEAWVQRQPSAVLAVAALYGEAHGHPVPRAPLLLAHLTGESTRCPFPGPRNAEPISRREGANT